MLKVHSGIEVKFNQAVLSNLSYENFRVANRRDNLDLPHCLLVLKSLGRFHAMSRVLLSKGLISNDDLKPMYMTSDSTFTSRLIKGGLTQASTVMASSWSPEWKETSVRIADDIEGSIGRLQELAKVNEDTYVVLNHGDMWIANLMFKYSPLDATEPIAVRFSTVPLQLVRLGHHLFHVQQHQTRRTPRAFQPGFGDLPPITRFHGNAEEAPSLEDIKSEIDRLDYFAFTVLTCVYPVVSADTTEALDMDKISREAEYVAAYNPEIFKSDKFKDAVSPELRTYMDSEMEPMLRNSQDDSTKAGIVIVVEEQTSKIVTMTPYECQCIDYVKAINGEQPFPGKVEAAGRECRAPLYDS
ncbi:hypothetical protein GE061_017242 [Apolygus lucorum]|uniref:CHK kinase-like domain-containing protein n=1 Tax=Apolygus lucorum TaxID=248454 RepID=A0A8S9XAK2_APOLU|nr:hypothetical protein GE061_017242 [Apolygus lucorum]